MKTGPAQSRAIKSARRPLAIVLPVSLGLLVLVAELLISWLADIPLQWWRIVPEIVFVMVIFGIYLRTRLSDPGRMDPRYRRRDRRGRTGRRRSSAQR